MQLKQQLHRAAASRPTGFKGCCVRTPARSATVAHSVATVIAEPLTQQASLPLAPRKDASPVHLLKPASFHTWLEEQADELVVVDYYTDWCGPCKLMEKELDKLARAFPKGVRFAKVNCGHHEEFATQQRVRSLPTLRLFKGGKMLEQVTGARLGELRQLLMYHYRPV